MKLSVSAYRAHSSAHKKILSSSYQSQFNYGSTAASSSTPSGLFTMETTENPGGLQSIHDHDGDHNSAQTILSPTGTVISTSETPASKDEDDSSNAPSSDCKSPSQRTKSNQRWMKLRTTVQISSAIQKKPPLKREDSFLKRFSTRQIPETQETVEDTGSESVSGDQDKTSKRRRRYLQKRRSVVNPDENFYFYWLMVLTFCILYNLWALIVRQSFPELQKIISRYWFICDCMSDTIFILDIAVQLRTGYLEQGLMVYDDKKLAYHYMRSSEFLFDLAALIPLDLLQIRFGSQPLLRCPRFLKVYRSIKFYYIVESRTVWPNLWRVVNLIHILLILAHWFGCFYFLLSEAEGFQGDWVYPYRPGDYATLTRKYLGSLYWSTLTLTTIGDLPTPETNAEYIFTIVSYLIGVFIFATIVGQVGNVITNRNANRLEFERLLDGAKTYMRHHKVPGGMKRRVLRWYDYSWSRGRIQGGGDINTALGLLPDKLKTELALHVNLSVLKKVTIFQECQPEFLHDLVLKMKAYIFTPGDSICRKGEVAREMFIIADGILEVLSETGKVLTTMKAGDFFGEIGILNLDGLNKRTADVRSVGYSELFSLSREDVLAAMKDYPEAQEILQTLGRKRLMEVRCVNKKHAKAASEKAGHNHQSGHTDNSTSDSTSKKFVEKFRSDVRGIKSVLRKSRTARRSNESLEMQPFHTMLMKSSSSSSKGVLRRMPRVRSDDIHSEEHEERYEIKDKTPSPIGAGLPLLQRLKLLKEKQDREERAVKSAPQLKSPPSHSHVTSAVSPQESIQEEPEPEVIGAGLPLFKRLQLLKAKEEKLAKEKTTSQTPLSSTIKVPINKHSPTATSPQNLVSPFVNPIMNNSPSYTVSKSTLKVSFKEKLKELQNISIQNIDKDNKQIEIGNIKEKLIPTISSICSKPSATTALKDKFKNFGQPQKEDTLKPWSKLKLATIVSSGSYSSLTNYSISDDNEKLKINDDMKISRLTKSKETEFREHALNTTIEKERTDKFRHFIFNERPKKYRSVDDLSPEYSGLPFVKKLKILNERQKLAELESVIQTRSLSLDCTEIGGNLSDITEPLYRSQSDGGSGLSLKRSRLNLLSSPIAPLNIPQCLNSPLSPESNETLERKKLKSILKKLNEDKRTTIATITEKTPLIANPQELQGLLNAPTIEGYVARHSKLMKSVTFNSTLSSPPMSGNTSEMAIDDPNRFTFLPMQKKLNIIQNSDDNNLKNTGFNQTDLPSTNNSASLVTSKKLLKGTSDEQEYFSEVLLGIKNVIQTHMLDIHNKFQDRFSNLESEVKRRDEIIDQLQNKIRELEIYTNDDGNNKATPTQLNQTNSPRNGSSGSSGELLFMRGDSLDTIFTSSPPISYDKHSTKSKCKKRISPRQRAQKHHQSWDESSDQESIESGHPLTTATTTTGTATGGGYSGMIISDVTGNISRMGDSVILTIDDDDDDDGDSSGSSTSSSKSKLDQEDDDNNILASKSEQLHCDDWEVRMLAAELDRRETQQVHSIDEPLTGIDEYGTLVRRRHKQSDTETECSEVDFDIPTRPRAASLDQYNLGHGKCKSVFKAMSFDRDKDRL